MRASLEQVRAHWSPGGVGRVNLEGCRGYAFLESRDALQEACLVQLIHVDGHRGVRLVYQPAPRFGQFSTGKMALVPWRFRQVVEP